MLNNVVLVGRLVNDPELKKTSNEGRSVARFRLASDDTYSKDGSEKTTIFIDVIIFGPRADTVAKYMRKGSNVGVIGRLTQRKYISQKTNTEVTVTEIIANSVEFVGPKQKPAEDSGFQSDIPAAPARPAANTGFGGSQSESSNLSGIDVVDDDLPF